MMDNIKEFQYSNEYYEGELRCVMEFISNCHNLLVKDQVSIDNHEDRIKNQLVKEYLKKRNVQRLFDFSDYLFDTETSSEYDDNYNDIGYIDLKVSLRSSTFDDNDLFFVIECKRLDGNRNLNLEYVKSGIARFTSTAQYPTALGCNGMIGFCVKKFDIPSNFLRINSILEKEFSHLNTLKELSYSHTFCDSTLVYYSQHKQEDKEINLYHLMLDYSDSVRIRPKKVRKVTKA